MRPSARINATIELLENLHSQWAKGYRAPADGVLHDYFKARRFMGSKDRMHVSELLYYILRHGGSIQWWLDRAQTESTPRLVVIMALVLGYDHRLADIEELFTGGQYAPAPLTHRERALIESHADQPLVADFMPSWAKHNIPEWMEPRLRSLFADDFEAEVEALNQPAPVDLRINTLKCPDRADLIMELDRLGYYGAPTPFSPLGVRLQKRHPVFNTDIFRKGWFEMQDEGSQIVAALVNAQPGEKVIDFCAGAGGKTLAIAAKMENKGRVLAWDVNEKRLNQIRKRLARAGVDNVITHALESENDQHIKRHKESADWVLVDAPCSGTGTWRRNPDLKWRTSATDLAETRDLQRRILASAARLVKPGGRLVYATCSLLPEENVEQVKTFIVDHPDFRVEPLDEMWNKHRLWSEGLGACLQMSPHRDATDGFFGAILQRS